MNIGILFDTPEDYPSVIGPPDRFAEFEPESTIRVMEKAIEHLGHTPVRLGGPRELLRQKPAADLVWNISEGYGSRNREAWGPVLLELHGIPYVGSDAFTLSLCLDKSAAKRIAGSLGIPTAPWVVQRKGGEIEAWPHEFPVLCKPRYEGTGKGISPDGIVRNEIERTVAIKKYQSDYDQDIICERFLGGAEYTVALWGEPLRAQPVLERALHPETMLGSHIRHVNEPADTSPWVLTQALTPELETLLHNWSLTVCRELDVRHVARLDFKCDDAGNPFFLEINPLPTFAVDNTFSILAELENQPYEVYLSGILKEAIATI